MNSPNSLVYALFVMSLVITKSASAQVAERKVLTLEGAKKVIAAAEAYASRTMLRAASSPSWKTVASTSTALFPPAQIFRSGRPGGHVPPNKLSEVAAWQRKAFQSTSGKEVEFRSLDAAPV